MGSWCDPEEHSVEGAYGKLEGRNGHGEARRPSGSLEGKLVGDIVVVVADVPEEKVAKPQHLVRGMSALDSETSDGWPIPRFVSFADNRDFFYLLRK